METLSQKQKSTNRNRFIITSVVLGTFFFIMGGIGAAILGPGDTPIIEQEWKETTVADETGNLDERRACQVLAPTG